MDLDAIAELATEPEYKSVEIFVQFCMDDDREQFRHVELRALALNTRTSGSVVREQLEGYGLTLAVREVPKKTRGFSSNSHDRWYGPGSSNSHGGSGNDQIQGFAGRRG
jgi:hypothetical protein